jgi:putative endonuclease
VENARDKGFAKEDEAAALLKKKGYKIIERNFLTPVGEIDIIAKHKDSIVFVEVKYRTSEFAGKPQSSVNSAKQKKIIKTAALYIQKNKLQNENVRFDVIGMTPRGFEIIENAFSAQSGRFFI